ncbi:MAG: pantoate--beta-alanine ligase [Gammaproteobacteria bacterium]
MNTIHHVAELRSQIKKWRMDGESICLVPTMGNLHEGHLALVDRAKQLSDHVIASIFVNPMQFIQGEDFETYPRTMEQDSLALFERGVNTLFAPEVGEVYPAGLENHTEVSVPALDGFLCGASRPGHFNGVATVVSKLFNLVQPDTAIFGQKDYQQLLVIKRMVHDLCIPIDIQSLPTVREEDGLALSSRNGYLSETDRTKAPVLYQQLIEISEQIKNGNNNFFDLEKVGNEKLKQHGFEPEYLSVYRQDDLTIADQNLDQNLVILVAARLGTTRLIDNILVSRS